MRIAVVGNSHSGCIKLAWDRIAADYPAVSMTFFAARANKMYSMHRSGSELIAGDEETRQMIKHTSGGLEAVDLTAYDALLFVGLASQPFFLPETPFYSAQVIASCLETLAGEALYLRLLKDIFGHFEGAVFITHTPLRAQKRKNRRPQDAIAYFNGVARLNQEILEPLGARMCTQPVETIVNGSKTDSRYSGGSVRLEEGRDKDGSAHADGDKTHMNADFGELWLRKFFADNFPQLST